MYSISPIANTTLGTQQGTGKERWVGDAREYAREWVK
jgi:hypothetical protein